MVDTDDESDDGRPPNLKRQRSADMEVSDIMLFARRMWQNADPTKRRSAMQEDRDFRETFGVGPFVVLDAWNKLNSFECLPPGGTMENMLWALAFCKQYAKTKAMCTLCGGVDAKTLRKWAWAYIGALADLESSVIVWADRFKGDRGADCTIPCDCVDFAIPNQGPAFSSHKFKKKSGLRYEICLCIQTGDVVWVNGPYPCGRYPDISIFRDCLMGELGDAERVEADNGYIGEAPLHCKTPNSFVNPEETEFMQQTESPE